jgi:hypothetical protein
MTRDFQRRNTIFLLSNSHIIIIGTCMKTAVAAAAAEKSRHQRWDDGLKKGRGGWAVCARRSLNTALYTSSPSISRIIFGSDRASKLTYRRIRRTSTIEQQLMSGGVDERRMGGRMDGWVDERMGGRTAGWTNEWMDGPMDDTRTRDSRRRRRSTAMKT